MAIDGAGNRVIADTDNNRVRVVAGSSGTFYGRAMTAGDIYTIAGNGTAGFGGDGGPATSARLDGPQGVAIGGAGNVVLADTFNNRVRVVAASSGTFYGRAMTAGDIYTIAGNGTAGFSGDGGPAVSAEMDFPGGVAVDGSGNLIIADTSNHRVRVVAASSGTFYGRAMTAGDIYTVAGDGTAGFSGDGGPAVSAEMGLPRGMAIDGSGNLVITDGSNIRVRVVAVRSGTFYGQAMTAGDIYTVAGNGTQGHTGNGGPAKAATLMDPQGAAFDSSGNLVIADGSEVRVVAESAGTFYQQAMTAGDIYLVAGNNAGSSGNGGRAYNAELDLPDGLAVSTTGNYLITDLNQVRMVPAASGTYFGNAMTAGRIYAVAGTGAKGYTGDGGRATAARLREPEGVALDGSGNLIIADLNNNRVRVVAAATGTFYGQAMTVGDIYTVAGNGTAGYSGDGGPATSAELSGPIDVAVDGTGNLIISDGNGERIRVVAAATGTFYGRAMTAGDIYTVAGNGAAGFSGDGGPATSAEIWGPAGVTVDGSGNLVFVDSQNNRVRVVAVRSGTFYGAPMIAGDIYSIAGTGTAGFSGDGGPATAAELHNPQGITLDSAGNVVITDTNNYRVRAVAAATGTFYGQTMTAGDIYTIAGNGNYGESGDGGAPTTAELSEPVAVGVDGAGNLVIVDSGFGRVRVVNG
jgi:ribulose-5-phosphate 4-epimerase/fuculose-1-phosphate aldolase